MSQPAIKPLCDKHNRVMVQMIVEGHAKTGDQLIARSYGCDANGCTRHYDVHEGYFDVVTGRPLMEKTGKTPCLNDEMALYLSASAGRSPERLGTWVCPECGTALEMKD